MKLFAARTATEAILEKQPPDHPEGFADDAFGHFGTALEAVGKNDGHFDDFHALPPDFVGQFDLKTVTVGLNGF